MRFLATVATGFRGVSRHPARAALNVIGLLTGIASVVLLVGLAQAVGQATREAVAGLGANLAVVYPSGLSSSGVQVGLGSGSSLTTDDVTALGNPGYVRDGIAAVPTVGLRDNVVAAARSWQTDVLGSTDQFASALGYQLASGRFFNAAELQASQPVVVLGQTVASNIFGATNPLGQLVRINNQPFSVIGLLASRGYSGSYNQDDLVVMPINSSWAYVIPSTAPRIQQIFVVAASANVTNAVQNEITTTLLQRHHITNPALADFQVKTDRDLLSTSLRVANATKWMLVATATIALLAGAAAIMSLMLSSVRERTPEIGIRRAVGAARADILAQFLIEAIVLAIIGGIAGVALGFGAASTIAQVFTDLPAPVVTPSAVGIALAVALGVGILAGLYPAARAALLPPQRAVLFTA